MGTAENVAGAVVVFAADSDVAGLEGGADGFEGEESEGVSEFFADVFDEVKVGNGSDPDLARLRCEASCWINLRFDDRTSSREAEVVMRLHERGSVLGFSTAKKKSTPGDEG
jgi:hypothetical protein